jgi:4-hydroxybenzoate polyprenyltransferase
MRLILDFFPAIRMGNLLIILVAQILLIHKLDGSFTHLSDYLAIIFLTSFVVLLGNLENNILDYSLDTECKKKASNRFVELFLTNHRIWIYESALFLCLAFVPILLTSKLIVVAAYALLKLYNLWAKRVALLGNLIIAVLCAMTILIVDTGTIALNYAFVIGLYTLIREIIKDKEDEKCDRIFGFRTLPILIEDRPFRILLIGLVVVIQIGLLSTILVDSLLFNAIIAISTLVIYYIYAGLWVIGSKAMKALILMGVLSLL